MVTREQIQRGRRVRLLNPFGNVAAGTVGIVQSIREERIDCAWAFSLYWEDFGREADFTRLKNRFSLYFAEGDLGCFEVVEEDSPAVEIHLPSIRSRRRSTKDAPNQLTLPFTEWVLYRGADVVGSFDAW